ncbi:methyl-accepting chemotaxis protein [Catenuloplanes japonicus]|uniref:methyl-accepting chemotaxis protein n=1 Tax=Catenuloplanes japonicus TaxID=33876 RepID=UPI000525377C|nr:CHASE3 domain-containing protein [Catenuloplanes japonicus]
MAWIHRIRTRMIAAFAVPLVVLCIVGTLAYRNTDTLETTSGWVSHTYQVMNAIDQVSDALQNAETGQRGFLITGQDAYLEPYTKAKDAVSGTIDTVAELTADNATQQGRIDELRPLVDTKFAEMQETIDLRRTQGFAAAEAVVLQNKGKAVMDQIRGLLDDMSTAESSLLDDRAKTTDDTADASRTTILAGVAIALVFVLVLAFLMTRSILRPLSALTSRLSEIANGEGDLTRRVEEDRRDEFGPLAAAFNRFVAKLAGTIGQIGEQSANLAVAAGEVARATTQISASAVETSNRADQVSSATEAMSGALNTVAAGAEEMGASIREISTNATEAARVVAEAVEVARSATETVSELGNSSAEITNVIKLITAIAEQTNLLALNATIEAARAGEAGKGFAVVASEVKDLAQETARATEDISRRVESMKVNADAAADAIGRMSDIVVQVNDYQTTIASAVEEQTATTTEMSRSVNEASGSTTEISANLAGVASAAGDTTVALTATQASVEELNEMSSTLKTLVGQFKY